MRILLFFISIGLACTPTHAQKLWTEIDRQYLLENLGRTKMDILAETQNLSAVQWNFKEEPGRWSIAEIIEHLVIHDEFTTNEIWVCLSQPPSDRFLKQTAGNDQIFKNYADDPLKADAGGMSPYGKFCDPQTTLIAYGKIANGIYDLVKSSDKDFRKHYAFRNFASDGTLSYADKYSIRDMHQRAVTLFSHTDRHLKQLRKIKTHINYPKK